MQEAGSRKQEAESRMESVTTHKLFKRFMTNQNNRVIDDDWLID